MHPKIRFLIVAAVAVASLAPCFPPGADAQVRVGRAPGAETQLAPGEPIDASDMRAIVEELAGLIREYYVHADKADLYADTLLAAHAWGRFDADSTSDRFAVRLTDFLRGVSKDKHFAVMDDAAGRTRFGVIDSVQSNRSHELRVAQQREQNFFFRKVEMLPGGVGCLKFDQFADLESARATAASAMQFLENAEAVLLDLRDNRGGEEGINQFIASYFFDDPDQLLYERTFRVFDSTAACHVLDSLPGRRFGPEVPLYVLTSEGTGSAAENLSYTLQQHGRATVVGDTTAGAGHSSTILTLDAGGYVVMPFSTVVHPVSGRGWEGVGVCPDIVVKPENAFDVAYEAALETLLARAADPVARSRYENALTLARAARHEPTDPAGLAVYSGKYGYRTITLADSKLWLQREGGPKLAMREVGEDTFVLERVPEAKIEFGRDESGAITELRVLGMRGQWETTARE